MIKANATIEAVDFIVQITAGEALLALDAVYLEPSDGKVYKCDADDKTKSNFIGFVLENTAINITANVLHNGNVNGFSGLTAGTPYYLSGTPGLITSTAPVRPVLVGVATSSTVIKIDLEKATQIFSVSGTYTIPKWARLLFVEGWGSGASGACARSSTSSAEASGGGAGAHRAALIAVSSINAATVAVTVGVGGAAVTIASGTSDVTANGNDGVDTTFGTFLVANKGVKGTASIANETSVAGGIGGTVSGSGVSFISEAGAAGGAGSSVGTGSAAAGGNATEAGGGGGGAAADSSSGNALSGAGGASTRAGAGGAGISAYQAGSGAMNATNGADKSGGGGAAAYQCGGGAAARALTSGKGGDGLLIVTAI